MSCAEECVLNDNGPATSSESDSQWTKKVLEWRPRGSTRNRGTSTRWTGDIKGTAGNQLLLAQGNTSWIKKRQAYVQQRTKIAE